MSIIGEAFVRISPESAEFAEKTKHQLTAALGGVGPAIGVAAAVAAVAALGEVGEKFAEARHQIQQETGATGEALDGLFNQVKHTFSEVPASLHDVTTAVDELSRRGVPAGAVLNNLATQELFLAKITKEDLATTVESTTALLAKFNVPLRDQSRELDVLFKAQQKSGKGLGDLVTGLTTGGAALGSFGFSLDESIALISGLERSGISIGPVLASLKKAFATLVKSGDADPKKALEDLFGELESGKNPTKAMGDALKLFGARGGVELARAVQQGKLNVHELFKEITDGKDGIVATGRETESLGDKIKEFRNQALVDIEPIGTAILEAFEKGVEEAAPVLKDLGTSVAEFVEALLPVLEPVGALLIGTFEVALPVIDAFATGLHVVAEGLTEIPAPILVGAAAFATLALFVQSAGGSMLATVAAAEAVGVAVDFALGPVGIIIGGITALGVATHFLSRGQKDAKTDTSALASVFDDTASSADSLSGRLGALDDELKRFLQTQLTSGKASQQGIVAQHAFGQSYTDVSTHLREGTDAYFHWYNGLRAGGKVTADTEKAIIKFSDVVSDARQQLEVDAQQALRAAVANGTLSKSHLDAALAANKSKVATDGLDGGHTDYIATLKALAPEIDRVAAKNNAAAAASANTKAEYRELVDALASGEITTDDAGTALAAFGFDADGAKAKVTELQAEIKAFLSAVQGQLPSVGKLAQDFGGNLQKDTDQLQSDLAHRTELLQQQAREGGAASDSLRQSIVENNQKIRDDYKVLVADSDPAKFTEQIKKQAVDTATFFTSIQTLVTEGFGALAGELLKLGPQAGASLAAGLAGDKTKATQANAAATFLNNLNAEIATYAATHEAELTGTGENVGATVADGVAGGVTKGTPAVKTSVQHALEVAAAITTKGVTGYELVGEQAGAAIGSGVASGLQSKEADILAAVSSQATKLKLAFDRDYRIRSPSKMTEEVGRFLGLGLEVGLKNATPAILEQSKKTAQETANAFLGIKVPKIEPPPISTTPARFLGIEPPRPQPATTPARFLGLDAPRPAPLNADQIAALKFIGSSQSQHLLEELGKLGVPKVTLPPSSGIPTPATAAAAVPVGDVVANAMRTLDVDLRQLNATLEHLAAIIDGKSPLAERPIHIDARDTVAGPARAKMIAADLAWLGKN